MDVQLVLIHVLDSIKSRNIGHARHLLRDVRMVSSNRYVQGLATNIIRELNRGSFQAASHDTKVTKLVDARESFTIAL